MTVAFTDADYIDFSYELNDCEIVNDVLCIVGAAGAEELVRGYDASSIAKYGRRSYRLDRAIVDNTAPNYATPKAQATDILDRNIEPYAIVSILIKSKTDALTATILGLAISELVTITQTTCGLAAAYFIVESIDLSIDISGQIEAAIRLVQARASEHP